MKKLLAFGWLCLILPLSLAQSVDIAWENREGGVGDTVCVPLVVQDFTDMVGLQFSVAWDTSVVEWVETADFNSVLGLSSANFGVNNAANGFFTFSWNDNLLTGVSLSDGDSLFRACFRLKGDLGDASSLCFTSTPTLIEAVKLINGAFGLAAVNHSCGSLEIIELCADFQTASSSTAASCALANGSITLTATGGVPPYLYELAGSVQPSGTFSNLLAGTYPATVIDANGCTDTLAVTVSEIPGPAVSLESLPEVCIDSAAFPLTGGSPAGGAFSGPGVTGNTFDPAAAGVGSHVITYTFVDTNGCSGTAMDTLVVHDLPPQPVIEASGDTLSTAGGGATYRWYLDGTLVGGGNDSVLAFAPDGVYQVEVISEFGCVAVSESFTLTQFTDLGAPVIEVFPNPARRSLQVRSKAPATLILFSLTGQEVARFRHAGAGLAAFQLPSLAQGLYHLRIQPREGKALHQPLRIVQP